MRNGLIGLTSALMLASTMATAGCSNSSSGTPDSGSGSSSGGSSSGGTTSGSSSGSATSGSSSGSPSSGSSSGSTSSCDAGTSPVTTVCGTATLGALTTAEQTQLCTDTFAYFAKSITPAISCKWQALTASASSSSPTNADLTAFCTMSDNSCLTTDAGAPPAAGCFGTASSSCNATVAQYSTCITDETTALIQTVGGLPDCSALVLTGSDAGTDADTTTSVSNAQGAPAPASCMTIESACGGVQPPNPAQLN